MCVSVCVIYIYLSLPHPTPPLLHYRNDSKKMCVTGTWNTTIILTHNQPSWQRYVCASIICMIHLLYLCTPLNLCFYFAIDLGCWKRASSPSRSAFLFLSICFFLFWVGLRLLPGWAQRAASWQIISRTGAKRSRWDADGCRETSAAAIRVGSITDGVEQQWQRWQRRKGCRECRQAICRRRHGRGFGCGCGCRWCRWCWFKSGCFVVVCRFNDNSSLSQACVSRREQTRMLPHITAPITPLPSTYADTTRVRALPVRPL